MPDLQGRIHNSKLCLWLMTKESQFSQKDNHQNNCHVCRELLEAWRVSAHTLQLFQCTSPEMWRPPSIGIPTAERASSCLIQEMCKHIAHLLGDYPSHGDKNCTVRASAIPSSLCPCAKKDARCLASELNSLSSGRRFMRFNLIS